MKRLLIPFLIFPSLVSAGPAILADCMFNQECIEGEACEVTNYQVMLYTADMGGFSLESVSETVKGAGINHDGRTGMTSLFATAKGSAHLLTIQQDGAARYSVQMDVPMVISYLGNCERAN